MEEPTFTAIDYNSLENKVIEGLVRDNYSKIKNTFYKVFNKRSKNPNSPVGLCADIIEASRYNDDPDRILWRKVIKPWFTPQRFNLTYVYFGYSTPLIQHLKEGGDRIWMEEIEMYYLFFYEIRNGRRLIGKNRVKKILDTIL